MRRNIIRRTARGRWSSPCTAARAMAGTFCGAGFATPARSARSSLRRQRWATPGR
jgi:hypothetical protein